MRETDTQSHTWRVVCDKGRRGHLESRENIVRKMPVMLESTGEILFWPLSRVLGEWIWDPPAIVWPPNSCFQCLCKTVQLYEIQIPVSVNKNLYWNWTVWFIPILSCVIFTLQWLSWIVTIETLLHTVLVYSVAITEEHRQGGLTNISVFSHNSGS